MAVYNVFRERIVYVERFIARTEYVKNVLFMKNNEHSI